MNKMMQADEQEKRRRHLKVDLWFKHYFGHIFEENPLYKTLHDAKEELKQILDNNP